jgi:hypothetical protein
MANIPLFIPDQPGQLLAEIVKAVDYYSIWPGGMQT